VDVLEVEAFQTEELRRTLRGLDAEIVFNLAAYGVDPEDQDPGAMLDGNVNLVARLLLALAGRPVTRFVHVGSCAEYGTPVAGERVAEDHAVLPTSLYGAAKAASVVYGNALARRLGIPFVTLRLFGVFGVGERPDRLIPYVIKRLIRDEASDLTPGEQVRDFLYVEDVAEALVIGARCAAVVPYTVYNVCAGQPVRVRAIAEAVADVMGKPRSLLEFGKRAYRADEAMWLVGSNQRFVGATGWRPKTSITDGIRQMVAAEEQTRLGATA
jgi:nucleoside-diphosphate-sugar epimerase